MGVLFRRRGQDAGLPRDDRGWGDLDDFDIRLRARRVGVTLTLANSTPYQDELRRIVASGETDAETAISPRTQQQEGYDAPIEVRLFTGRGVSGVVGIVPRGLESIVDENLRRLDDTGQKPRIPARVVHQRGAYRVELLMGRIR